MRPRLGQRDRASETDAGGGSGDQRAATVEAEGGGAGETYHPLNPSFSLA